MARPVQDFRRGGQALLRIIRVARNMGGVSRTMTHRFGPLKSTLALRRIVVFPKLGLAYNRVKKNANTSVLLLLRELETGVSEDRAEAKWNATTLLDLDPSDQKIIDDLSFFIVVRNPYSRVLSAFLDKMRSPVYRRKIGNFDLSPEGFLLFLRFMQQGGLSKDAHWDLQSKLIALPLDQFDKVIHFESFREEMLAYLADRRIDVPDGSLQNLFPADQNKRTGANEKLTQFYLPQSKEIVRTLYADDFSLLGYPPDFPDAGDAPTR